MSKESATTDRRRFLTGAVTGAASLVVAPTLRADAQEATTAGSQPSPAAASGGAVPPPTVQQVARDSGLITPGEAVRAVRRPGSDLMTQVLKDLGIEYVASNPGSSFEGLHESIVNYGDPPNVQPEFVTALHEETSVDMAHGYAKATGRPMCALLHGSIGLMHASMAIYQAYYAGVPMVLIVGRDEGFIQAHTADDLAGVVRSYTKWDAQPRTLPEALEAIQEAYRQAITPPTAPTVVVLDIELQKEEAGELAVPAYRPPKIEGIDAGLAREIAKALLSADNPRIEVGRLRTPEGVGLAVELAGLVGACVGTQATEGPMSFPQGHALSGPGAATSYDYTLGLEAGPADVGLIGPHVSILNEQRDRASIGFGGLRDFIPPNIHPFVRQMLDRTRGVQRVVDADAEASLPEIIGQVRKQLSGRQQRLIEQRSARHAQANRSARLTALRAALDKKRVGWNGSPISTARIYAELWPLIAKEDWCLASPTLFSGAHHRELWLHDRPYSYLGIQSAGGIGYGVGACVGAGLAAKSRGRIVINIQTDGDLNYAPGALWSAVHHKLPVLNVMHNNRAWHQEVMFMTFMAGVRGRGTDRSHIGTALRDPFIDYARMAEAYGMHSEGPIADPEQLKSALERGLAAVKRGEPYLIDVLTQPR